MRNGDFNWIVNCVRCIADYAPQDLHVRGKLRDVILPMTVPRPNGVVLEGGRQPEVTG